MFTGGLWKICHGIAGHDQRRIRFASALSAARICDGKAMPRLLNPVQSRRFSRRDLKRFRTLLEELEGGRR